MHNLCGRAPGGWALTLIFGFSLLVFSGQPLAPAYAAQSFTLEGPERSREGYFQLQVNGLDDDQAFVIELASAADFAAIDSTFSPLGSFRQLSLSGFDDGTYYFRARLGANGDITQGDDAVYSNVVQVQVEHYPLWQALGLFGLGAVLFIALTTTLLRLHWRTRKGSKESGYGSGHDG